MSADLLSFVAAQHIQDRIAAATSARLVREVKRARQHQPMRRLRRWVRARRGGADAVVHIRAGEDVYRWLEGVHPGGITVSVLGAGDGREQATTDRGMLDRGRIEVRLVVARTDGGGGS